MGKDKKLMEEDIKNVIEALFSSMGEVNDYELFEKYSTDTKEIFTDFFSKLIAIKEGGACSVDKGSYIAGSLIRAFKDKQNKVIGETYQQYKDRGGDLGGIDETNTDMGKLTYWSPKTIKDTDQALKLFQSVIFCNFNDIQEYLKGGSDE